MWVCWSAHILCWYAHVGLSRVWEALVCIRWSFLEAGNGEGIKKNRTRVEQWEKWKRRDSERIKWCVQRVKGAYFEKKPTFNFYFRLCLKISRCTAEPHAIFAYKTVLRSAQNSVLCGQHSIFKKIRFRLYVSSLGRYVFGSEISYNKAPPRLPGLGC
jgi:hypothetical protein